MQIKQFIWIQCCKIVTLERTHTDPLLLNMSMNIRDKELLCAYRNILKSSGRKPIVISDVFRMLTKVPASQFFVSPTTVYRYYCSGIDDVIESMSTSTRKEMYVELKVLIEKERERYPDIPLLDIVQKVVSSPAPRFYMTEAYIKRVIYECKRRRKLR